MTPAPQEGSPQVEVVDLPDPQQETIVISGISGVYPETHSVEELCEKLYNKDNPISKQGIRFKFNHPEVVQYGGSVPDLQCFDAQFFKVHYRLSQCMDPMGRMILEHAYQAIYDAGVNPVHLSGKKIGVYIGTCFSESEKTCFYEAASRSGFGIAGCSKTMFANRVSYWLNAKGPSMSIDEACCSSTAALEQAFLAMSRGECEAAIVGGAYLCLHPQSAVHYGRLMKLCQDGKTKSFDENADGCAKSEAINVLFLQKAKDALRVYAQVVHAKTQYTGILSDETGPKYGFERELEKSVSFVKTFYEEAKISPQAVEYVEAFGCAVPEADKTELQSIEKVYCDNRPKPLLVGSVLSNIGYNEAASGLSGVTKVLLGYHTGKLAANLHCTNPRQDVVALKEGRMRIVTEHEPFSRQLTAINGLSVTGLNAHVLLHGQYRPKDLARYKSSIPYLVTISGRHEAAVTHILNNLKSQPIDPEQLRLLNNIHQTSISGHLGRGFTILKTDEEEQKTVCLSEKSTYFDNAAKPLWFVYSGMGSQWAGMGAELMRIPIFAAAIERCRRVLEPKGIDIVNIITSQDEKMFDNILHSFVGIAAVQIGLTDVLTAVGLVPDGIIGHSVGELGCAYADGCLTAEEMILSAYSRGLVSLETPFIRGSMAAIGLGYENIVTMCPPEIEVACHNGPESSTISGPADKMKEFVAELTAKGIFAKEVPCSNIAYHSRYIAGAGPGLLKYLSEVITSPKPRTKRWLSSSVPQDKWDTPGAQLCSAHYHTNNLLSPVLFEETSRLIPADAVLVEVAPHGLLQAILKRSLPSTCTNIALTRRKHKDNAFLVLESIGKLFMEGYNPKLHVLYPEIELPVSTGTPFLSNLVQWAHGETWSLAYYKTANRTAASSCDHLISWHDAESNYLKGNSIRGRTLFPFAATFILVWDTLSMILGLPKKQHSVKFSQLNLFAQPILHDMRQLKLNVTLCRGTGDFEVISENTKIATGSINLLEKDKEKRHEEPSKVVSLDLTAEDIYKALQDRDYSYKGEFRSIAGADESFNAALIAWNNNWVTLIDGILQLHMLREPHTAVSVPSRIRTLTIDVERHDDIVKSVKKGNKALLKAEVDEQYDITRCGGVSLSSIMVENLPPVREQQMSLEALKFVPNTKSVKNVASSFEVFLRIVGENVNKDSTNVVGIVNKLSSKSIFNEVNEVIKDVYGLNAKYEEISREMALKDKHNDTLTGADAVLVQNLSVDDDLCSLLHRALQNNQFVISEEDLSFGVKSRPSSLYRVLCLHTLVNDDKRESQLQLVRWGRAPAQTATTTITVRSESDFGYLSSTRSYMTSGHRLLIIAPYPSINGLKELVQTWRKEQTRNKIDVLMVHENSNEFLSVNEIPDIDLAFTVLKDETWGSEHFVSVNDSVTVSKDVTLQSTKIGDLDSLTWVEAPKTEEAGVEVKVHYAGLNQADVRKVVSGLQDTNNRYGMDFSGVTNGAQRVMGLVPAGAASSVVRARPELLWPVPAHWSLEDAATVPLAYAQAFYCLMIKSDINTASSVLVHGGSGAFGQAVISIALAYDCKVFTTVSDTHKKRFLLKLFPKLKAEHIGYSRNASFKDMVKINTQGLGCRIVINTMGGKHKNASIDCVDSHGIFIDNSQIPELENFSYGMFHLTRERNYTTTDFQSMFKEENINDRIFLKNMITNGITSGVVRPLSRVSFAPREVSRAFRLLAASRHRGKVLLNMTDSSVQVQPRITATSEGSHLILCNEETLGLQLADRLVERGAKKLCVYVERQSMPYVQLKIRSWQRSGVRVVVLSDDVNEEVDVTALVSTATRLGPLEGVYVTVGNKTPGSYEGIVNSLDAVTRKLCAGVKYFAVLNVGGTTIGTNACLKRAQDKLPATLLALPELGDEAASYRSAVDAAERALRSAHPVLRATPLPATQTSLLQEIISIAKISIPSQPDNVLTLEDLGLESDKISSLLYLFRVKYNMYFEPEQISSMTIERINKLSKILAPTKRDHVEGLSNYFSYVDSDELLATTEFVFMPTRTCSAFMRDDEFDTTQSFLCLVPGIEGHYNKFQGLCERLKLTALVLQPGLDKPNESARETAERYAAALLKKTGLQKKFYLLGYENGVSVALEIAAILEDNGLTGIVYCVGYSPEGFTKSLEKELSKYETKEQLQDAVARHMSTLMAKGDTTGLDSALQGASTWSQKVDSCVRTLLGRVSHSAQYARALIETALVRIEKARTHVPSRRALRSQLVQLLPAAGAEEARQYSLQHHSQQPVIVHELDVPLALATSDLRCPAIINSYLDTKILEDFETKNICNTYLLNSDSYMQLNEQ